MDGYRISLFALTCLSLSTSAAWIYWSLRDSSTVAGPLCSHAERYCSDGINRHECMLCHAYHALCSLSARERRGHGPQPQLRDTDQANVLADPFAGGEAVNKLAYRAHRGLHNHV
ncbi:hypothetical protein B0T22DRAFT_198014 [Podospora appendiculata]|uniref:Uncharacterized protein n=1 Tax=Podospora appendiculata TaxID=314037 RepID=A0AAE0X486_9PEZI|nr:hypothetical protein B0T22DRAFT_198014 [Podospora appendiculata]